MNTTRKTLWLAIAGAGLALSSLVRAQDEYGFEDESAAKPAPVYQSYIELGGGYVDGGDGKFGEYGSGMSDAMRNDGGLPLAGLRWIGGDTDTAREWRVEAGTGSARVLEASYGVQGDYGLSLFGDRIERVEYGDARTVYSGDSSIARLPPTYVPGTSSGDPAFYTTTDIVSERSSFGFEGFKQLGDTWKLSLSFENQDKTGDDTMGGNQGFNGTGLVPETLNHGTRQASARIDYADSCLQSGLEIYASGFDNDNSRLAFQNANFDGIGIEELALEPDNEFLRLGLDGGYTFQGHTRLSWFADWSRGEQDDGFPAMYRETGYYNPALPQAYTPTSLDGEVERSSLRLALAGRPFARFDYRAQFEYKDRDATHDAYPAYLVSYREGADVDPFHSTRVYDKQTQHLSLDAGYRFTNRIRLRAGLAAETMDRDTEEFEYPAGLPELADFTDSTDESGGWAELSVAVGDSLTLKLRGERNETSADLSDETEEFIAPGGDPYRATPVFLRDRDQDILSAEANLELGSRASAYISYDMRSDEFDSDTPGLESRDADVWNLGFGWAISEAAQLSAYLSREEYSFDQNGRQMPSGGDPTPYFTWGMDSDDEVDAFGLTLDWAVVENRFDLSFDLAYLDSESSYASALIDNQGVDFTQTTPPAFGDMPDSQDELLRVNLVGKYHVNAQIDVTGRLLYEDRDAEDWGWTQDIALAAAPPPNAAQVVAWGWERPDYSAKMLLLSVRYKF